jgi:hypothetical protein
MLKMSKIKLVKVKLMCKWLDNIGWMIWDEFDVNWIEKLCWKQYFPWKTENFRVPVLLDKHDRASLWHEPCVWLAPREHDRAPILGREIFFTF